MDTIRIYVYRCFFIIAFLLVNIGFVNSATVPEYYSYNFDVSEGLSSNTVFKILKWRDFVWVATRQGVDMYNGYSFKHYNLFNDDIRTLRNGQKISIYTDGGNYLWAYTNSGQIYIYDTKSDSFKLFWDFKDFHLTSSLNSLLQIGMKLYACTSNGINCINLHDKSLLFKGLNGLDIRCAQTYGDNSLLVGGVGVMYILTNDLQLSKCISPMGALIVETIYVDYPENRIWIGCEGSGVWIYEKGHLSQIQGDFNSAIVRSVVRFDENNLLIGCDGMGVYKLDINSNTSQLFASDIVPPGVLSLRTSSVYDILVDKGNIWVTSFLGGVTLFRKDSDFVLVKDEEEKVGSANFVHGICEGKDGDIWMAFNFCIGCYNYNDNTFKKFLSKEAGYLSVALDDYGYLWCGGYNSGIYRLNTQNGNFDFYPSLSGNKEKDCVFSICKDSLGNIWAGGMNFDLTKLIIKGEEFQRQHYNLNKISTLIPVSKDSLFVGTADGLYVLNIKTDVITSVFNSSSAQWIGSTYINGIVYSKESEDVWIGTDGGGLLCYNLKNKMIVPYTTRNGLPSNYIMALQKDCLQRLWVSTENAGLFVFDTKSRKLISSLKRYEGLFFNEFFPGASCLLKNGNFVFGGYYGALVFSPLSVSQHSEISRICFTDLRIGAEEITMATHPYILSSPLNQMKELRLPYESRSFTLAISTNDLYNQRAAQFHWRLLGYENDWNFLNPQNAISLTNLTPGKYTLQIKVEDTWSNSVVERSIDIFVDQVLWLRWYMVVVYILLLLIFVYWGVVAYNNYVDKLYFEEKINFFVNIAHDIKTPLTLVASPLEKLSKLINNSEESDEKLYLLTTARNSVSRLSGLVNELMDLSKLSIQKEESSELHSIDLRQYIDMLNCDYQTFAEEKGLYFRVNIHPGNYLIHLDVGLLNRVFDNLLSNAFKYTFEGGVTVDLSLSGNYAMIEIKDTGIGMSSASAKKIFQNYHRGENVISKNIPGSGIGLFFTYRLVKRLGGKLSFKTTLNVGTTFCLFLPLAKDNKQLNDTSKIVESKSSIKSSFTSSNKETILLVEDNYELREYLFHSLSVSYNVLKSSSAEEGIKILRTRIVDLIISDVIMPGMRGDEFCKQIKNYIETSHIPVILLTANSDKDSIAMRLDAGADDYITKPFEMDILELKIRNVFVNRRKLHSYYLSRMNIKKSEENIHSDTKTLKDDIDSSFLQTLTQVINDNISNSEFTVNDLCNAVALSRTLLYEKTRKLLGLAPNDLIREIRMKQAKAWLEEGHFSVTTVAIQCGYPDVRYFSTVFKKYYGISPSKIIPVTDKRLLD